MNNEINLKIKISEGAALRFVENKRFTIQSLAKELELSPTQIFGLFPNRKSILLYFYESRIIIYNNRLKLIKDYPSFSLSERLSNFFLTLFDMFMEHREFVLLTYENLIIKKPVPTAFEKSFKQEIENIFSTDTNISSSSAIFLNWFFYSLMFSKFNSLFHFWSNDDSKNYETTMAFIDKWCSFIQEIFYSKIIDKSFDLGKFLFYYSPLRKLIINK